MQQHQLVDKQFGQVAQAYLSSSTHAQGRDLEDLAALACTLPYGDVLDLGCGGGHVSFAMAPHVGRLTAFDLSDEMLAAAGFDASVPRQWRLTMAFDTWFARIRTPQLRADAVRDLFERAPDEVRQYFALQPGQSFEIDVAWITAAPDSRD
ncbi:MAG: methyltransferase domain-containing protein [Burkholderiaceae bacterium]|nr:methyltransferase domain-containing protein [Burkholderiaceae bacterium]